MIHFPKSSISYHVYTPPRKISSSALTTSEKETQTNRHAAPYATPPPPPIILLQKQPNQTSKNSQRIHSNPCLPAYLSPPSLSLFTVSLPLSIPSIRSRIVLYCTLPPAGREMCGGGGGVGGVKWDKVARERDINARLPQKLTPCPSKQKSRPSSHIYLAFST